jgi:NOL1/NOP2/fmu family ribosome biogenesis protein
MPRDESNELSDAVRASCWATAIAMQWLQSKCAAKKDVWELLFGKAEEFLKGNDVNVQEWLSKATSVL